MPGMLDKSLLALLAAFWLLSLFFVARLGERWATHASWQRWHPWLYTLGLGVYCTTWTFFGSVGQMASTGWWFPPTYLGAILLFVFGWRLIDKVIRVSKAENISSLADLLAARYGHSHAVAVLTTSIAFLGVIPYIALQLKGIANSVDTLSYQPGIITAWWQDSSLLVTLAMSAFLLLFGLKHFAASDQQPGMLVAVAFESLLKLFALAAVVIMVLQIDLDPSVAPLPIQETPESSSAAYLSQAILGAMAMLCLPRQFHITVVEHQSNNDLPHARIYYTIYLLLLGLVLVPLSYYGQHLLSGQMRPDDYVLGLPLSQGNSWIAAVVFIGSLAAGTSMLIVAVIALMTMVSHTFLIPLTLRLRQPAKGSDFIMSMRWLRRVLMCAIILMAFLYYRWVAEKEALAQIGLISFSAVAQFFPPLLGGLYWKSGNRHGAIAGLSLGGLTWCWTLVYPAMSAGQLLSSEALLHGPFAIEWLKPTAMFGLSGFDTITHGALTSLSINTLAYILVSLATQQSVHERLQALGFVQFGTWSESPQQRTWRQDLSFRDIENVLARFLGVEAARQRIEEEASRRNYLDTPNYIDQEWLQFLQRELTGLIGSASAQVVIDAHFYAPMHPANEMLQLVDAATAVMQFNQQLLSATLNTLNQGVVVVDKDQRVVAWNPRYAEMFALPKNFLSVGRPIADVLALNAERFLDVGNVKDFINKRLHYLRLGQIHHAERSLNNGCVLEIHGSPMPGGGYVTSYSDITEHKKLADALEKRVSERTAELAAAKSEAETAKQRAEEANASKTRFLAAASHDLVQPLNAAQLFASALSEHISDEHAEKLLQQLGQSLQNSEDLLRTLLDISKFDAGVITPKPEAINVRQLLLTLQNEFSAQAEKKQLSLRVHCPEYWVNADPNLTRRLLQNLLSNALRYCEHGGVLLAARKRGDNIRFEVWDTGFGIEPKAQQEIFEEFKRHLRTDKVIAAGYGLGLAIVKRLSKAMNAPIELRSQVDQGSVFAFSLPAIHSELVPQEAIEPAIPMYPLAGLSVLCLDNDPDILNAIVALLSGWGCEVFAARDRQTAQQLMHEEIEVIVADYQLDQGDTGIDVWLSLPEPRPPLVVISAMRDPALKVRCLEYQVVLLHKPIKPLALRGVLQGICAKHELLV